MLKKLLLLLTICFATQAILRASHRAHRSLAVRSDCAESDGSLGDERYLSRAVLPAHRRVQPPIVPMLGDCCFDQDEIATVAGDAAVAAEAIRKLRTIIAEDHPQLSDILQVHVNNLVPIKAKPKARSPLLRECFLPDADDDAVENAVADELGGMDTMRAAIKLSSNLITIFSILKQQLSCDGARTLVPAITDFIRQLEAVGTVSSALVIQILQNCLRTSLCDKV